MPFRSSARRSKRVAREILGKRANLDTFSGPCRPARRRRSPCGVPAMLPPARTRSHPSRGRAMLEAVVGRAEAEFVGAAGDVDMDTAARRSCSSAPTNSGRNWAPSADAHANVVGCPGRTPRSRPAEGRRRPMQSGDVSFLRVTAGPNVGCTVGGSAMPDLVTAHPSPMVDRAHYDHGKKN